MRLTDAATKIALKNVLLATDFSPVSEKALLFAMAVCRRYGSKLFAVHAISSAETPLMPPEYWGAWQQDLDEAEQHKTRELDERLRELPHQNVLQRGGVWEVISETIRKNDIDLLVMGTRGRHGLGRLLMGSVAEELFRQSSCPVLTVGPNVLTNVPEIGFKEIIFATDFGVESPAAAPYAISLAQEYQAGLTLLHVVTDHIGPFTDSDPIVLERSKHLRALVDPEATSWCRPRYVVEFGDPGEHILRAAEEKDADLIVMGVRPNHVAGASRIVTTTAHTVVSRAACPVLTVRG